MRIGFVGLGNMGRPMASCLAKAGKRPLLWARNPDSAAEILPLGADLAPDIPTLFAECQTVFTMLADGNVMDNVFGRGTPLFGTLMRDRILVHMGTTPPAYSKGLETDIRAAGGTYVELPVSGSSGPAAEGQLVAMAAGAEADIARVAELAAPMVSSVIRCGRVPQAMQMKLAVNAYLGGLILGLFEAYDFARRCDLDLATFSEILSAGPMSNALMRVKLQKLHDGDYAPLGSIRRGINNWTMIQEAGEDVSAEMSGTKAIRALFEAAGESGYLDEDMIAICKILAARNEVR